MFYQAENIIDSAENKIKTEKQNPCPIKTKVSKKDVIFS